MKEIYQSGEYAQANPTWHAEDSPWKVGQILRMFKKHDLHPTSIAEIGCGAGEILLLLHNALPDCPEFHGFDIAPLPIEMAKKKETPRLNFHNEDLLKSPQVLDLLLIIDVAGACAGLPSRSHGRSASKKRSSMALSHSA